MDKLSKSLLKLSPRERSAMEALIARILAGDTAGLDVKKLKGIEGVFRIRKGSLRIIYIVKGTLVTIVEVSRRSDTTYNL